MKRQKLGQTDIEVSVLGFGCVQLTSHPSRKEAITILEQAFASGITHFDIARSYGFGRAEGVLAGFLRAKRDKVTVATKFGFELPSGLSGNPRFISLAKKILKPFPGLLRRAKDHGSSMVRSGAFSPEMAIKSLEKSLQELRTDYIDVFLLHEATLLDVVNEQLIETLQQQVAKGTIRCFGVASDFEKLGKDITLIPPVHMILQFNDNVIDKNKQKLLPCESRGIVTHSIFKPLNTLLKAIDEHPEIAKKFSLLADFDLFDVKVVSNLLLHSALQSNAEGVVLFSSMSQMHIKKNVEASGMCLFNEDQLSVFIEFANALLKEESLFSSPPLLAADKEIACL